MFIISLCVVVAMFVTSETLRETVAAVVMKLLGLIDNDSGIVVLNLPGGSTLQCDAGESYCAVTSCQLLLRDVCKCYVTF